MPDTNPDLRDVLDEYLETEIPTEPEPEGGWPEGTEAPVAPPADEDLANRMLYKGRKLTQELAKVKALASAERARVKAFEDDLSGGITRELTRLGASLEMFTRNWHRMNPRAGKQLKLPNGTLKLSKTRGKVVVTDKPAFMAWASKNARHLLRSEPQPALNVLADEMQVTRHKGTQHNVDELGGELSDTWRLMVAVETPAEDGSGEIKRESVTIPGVIFAEPVTDTFGMVLAKDEEAGK